MVPRVFVHIKWLSTCVCVVEGEAWVGVEAKEVLTKESREFMYVRSTSTIKAPFEQIEVRADAC